MSHEVLLRLEYDHLLYIHEAATAKTFAWRRGVRSRVELAELVEKVHEMARSRTSPTDIAATTMHFIATRQPFWDGNRRTAFATGQMILGHFNLEIKTSVSDVELFKSSIMWMRREDLEAWIRSHVTVI